MGSHKHREARQVVCLNARMRRDDGWMDIAICNVSSRGLMARCPEPPVKGAFVEIRRGSCCVIGHVRWSGGVRFGIRSQDEINVTTLVEERPEKRSAVERRVVVRSANSLGAPKRAVGYDQSRDFARLFEWCAISVAILVGAILLMSQVKLVLSQPLQQARHALGASNSR